MAVGTLVLLLWLDAHHSATSSTNRKGDSEQGYDTADIPRRWFTVWLLNELSPDFVPLSEYPEEHFCEEIPVG
ncbi:hydroperoxide isomerase ALOXE3-like protein [Lates japonicus]|uniref:Hydroperoxide isomerase ALOXE3-like protein n=1 Tax=Lates japonicus TaxID=270547 RepID=A0AAD3ME38_LATJO|nr:hydroperoxide isomerase ALOXE3-like protein [Lates japonicus]